MFFLVFLMILLKLLIFFLYFYSCCLHYIFIFFLYSEVFEINPQIKWFKNCVFFFCLDTLRQKFRTGSRNKISRTKYSAPPGNPALLLFIPHARFHKDIFCKKMKPSVFINISVLSKLFLKLYIAYFL